MLISHYTTLGVNKSATLAEIRKVGTRLIYIHTIL